METLPNLVTVDVDATPDRAGQADAEVIIDGVLDALALSKTAATFFVSCDTAVNSPALTRRIVESGHEVACLSMTAPSLCRPYSPEFTTELQGARGAIEDTTGVRVRGHRNATFAVDYSSEWAYDVLVDEGFEYDSSRIPPRRNDFGDQPVPTSVHAVRRWAGTLLEIPVTRSELLSMRIALGSTGTVRGIPQAVWRALAQTQQARGESIHMHLRVSELRRQSFFNRKHDAADRKTLKRVSGIVEKIPFTSVSRALPDLLRSAPTIES